MAELIAELLILFESLKFWKKKKARRKFESENQLPKKVLIHPTTVILLLAFAIILAVGVLVSYFKEP